jgi:signal transduction histidine kinase
MSRNASGLGLLPDTRAHHESMAGRFEASRSKNQRMGLRARHVVPLLAAICFLAVGAVGMQSAFAIYTHFGWAPKSSNHATSIVDFCAGVLLTSLVAVSIYAVARSRAKILSSHEHLEIDRGVLLSGSSSVWTEPQEQGKNLSRELHDSVGPILTGIGLQLNSMRRAQLSPDQMRSQVDEITVLNAEALRLVRDLAMGVRPSLSSDTSLVTALEWRARQFTRQTGINTVVDCPVCLNELLEEQRVCIYRCVDEALTNCAKYSEARNVRIDACVSDDALTVTVEDDGIGFDQKRMIGRGLGLLGMRERSADLGGTFCIAPRKGGGTSVTLEIPIVRSVLV